MFTYIALIFGLLLTGFVYHLETYLIVKESVTSRYNRWKNLNQLVSTTESSKMRIFCISMQMILQTLYISFLQYMNTTVRKLDRKTYEVRYVIDGKIYNMIVRPTRGPAPVLQISNDKQNDVTDQVLPYMGPQYDWHHTRISPEFFGYNSLTFELMDGTEHTYNGDSHVDYTHKKLNRMLSLGSNQDSSLGSNQDSSLGSNQDSSLGSNQDSSLGSNN